VPPAFTRGNFIFGKDVLVEGTTPSERVNVDKRKKKYNMDVNL
jgi:hypothetical protein